MRLLHIAALFALLLGLGVGAIAGAAETVSGDALVAQAADVSDYPDIALTVTLPVEMLVGAEGDAVFRVYENGEEIEILDVDSLAAVRTPIDIVLLVDTSGSMWGQPMEDTKRAAKAFVAAIGPSDGIAVVSFDTDVRVLADFTDDRDALIRAISRLEAMGRTALYDGVVTSADMFAGREAADRVIVLLSDGGDNASADTLDEAVARVQASGATMYAIGLETPETDRDALAVMAAQSGGRLIWVTESADLERLYEDIARELTAEYRVTFESAVPNTKDLELQVVAEVNGRTASTSLVIGNPYFELAEGEGTGVTPASPAASLALAALIIGLAFSATSLATWSILGIFGGRSSRLEDLRFYDQLRGAEDTTTTRAAGITGAVRTAVAVVAGRRGLTPLVHEKLEKAGFPLRPVEYMYLHLVGVVSVGVLTQLLARSLPLSLLVVVVATVVPILLLENAITRRRRAFEEQLPEILSMMASSLRAGWGIQQSIDLVVQEMANPASQEFKRVQAESRLGLSVEEALEKMADRLDSDDFRWTVTAIAIQREVGGNLAEVLDLVAGTMRERAELRRHISALTSEGRLSAVILFLLPPVMVGLLLLVNPGYIVTMFTSVAGMVLLVIGVMLLVVGGIWLKRVAEVEI